MCFDVFCWFFMWLGRVVLFLSLFKKFCCYMCYNTVDSAFTLFVGFLLGLLFVCISNVRWFVAGLFFYPFYFVEVGVCGYYMFCFQGFHGCSVKRSHRAETLDYSFLYRFVFFGFG